jgi:hypothetical protein
MARRSILSAEVPVAPALHRPRVVLSPADSNRRYDRGPEISPAGEAAIVAALDSLDITPSTKPCRVAKLHIGGYFAPDDQDIIEFQKLKIDMRKSQQDMLYEALCDYVAKQKVARAFR